MSYKADRYRRQDRPRRRRGRNRHHLTPRSVGGRNEPSNILLFDIERHCEWHHLFKNRTLDQVIDLLIRVKRAKNYRPEVTHDP